MVGIPGSSVASPVMVGREAESARLDRVLAGLVEGRRSLVIVSGEAGIGKTRLIDEVTGHAGATLRVLRGECLALGSGIPYLPFAGILRDLVRQVPSQQLSRLLGPARTDLSRLLPELAVGASTRHAAEARSAARSDELERLRLYESLLQVAERIAADKPTVFVVEDVQWIDRASLELLAFMAHGFAHGEAGALIVSVRQEEAEDRDSVLTLLADLGRSPALERIELSPLTAEDTRRLVTAIRGQVAAEASDEPIDELGERIHELSDGNPLFAEELLAASPAPATTLPPRLRDLLAARLVHVPADVLAVLRVAAAAGRSVDEGLLARASQLGVDEVRAAVRAAVEAHLLVVAGGSEGGAGYRFRHEILRALVASQLLPDESRQLHAAYARALGEEPVARRNATEIASHWDAAAEPGLALAAHLEAGHATLLALAFTQAHRHFERALELWDQAAGAGSAQGRSRASVILEASSAAAKAGRFERAVELTREALSAPGDVDVETLHLARSSLRWYLRESGDLDGARREAEAVLAAGSSVAPGGAIPDRWRANALAHLAGILLYQRHTAEAAARAREARDLAVRAEAPEERIMAEGVLGWCLLLEGDVEQGLSAIGLVLEATTSLDEGGRMAGRYPVGPVLAHNELTAALELVGRFGDVHRVALTGMGIAVRQGVGRTYGSLLQASAARALYQLGRWQECADLVDGSIAGGAVGSGRVSLLAVRAMLAVGRGDDDLAAATLDEAEQQVDDRAPLGVRRWLAAARVEETLWQGRPMEGLSRLAFLVDDPDAQAGVAAVAPGTRPAVLDASIPHLLALAARACADVGLQERASGAEEAFSAVAIEQVRASLRRVKRQRALAAAWSGDLAMAVAELERTGRDVPLRARRWKAALQRVADRPYTSAYAQWRLAEAQLAVREGRSEAAAAIESGLATASSIGAARIVAELRDLARRARLTVATEGPFPTVSPVAAGHPYGLTARELEVVALLAESLSNQEIAERLFISPKTASVHVSNIYSKLGVESRVAAATIAHSLGLAGLADEP